MPLGGSGMAGVDSLAFDIGFALLNKPIGKNAQELLRSLSQSEIDYLSVKVADHLRRCGWQMRPPDGPGLG
jgi:hypothetical protein